MDDAGMLRVASSNLGYGGVSESGDASALEKTVSALREWQPHIILLQEMTARTPESETPAMWGKLWTEQARVRDDRATEADAATIDHMKAMAASLGMTPLLGPPVPMMFRRMHTAIMVTADAKVIQAGPPAPTAGSPNPAWTEAVVRLPGLSHDLAAYSVHMPARSAVAQLMQAEWVASIIAQRGRHAVAGGDWNSLGRADQVTQAKLRAMSPHLRTARMTRDDGRLGPDYAVEDVLTTSGLHDAAAALPPAQRDPRVLTRTGRASRVDRFYVTDSILHALRGYRQRDTGGSDHHAIMVTIDLAALAQATPPGPRP
jgi:endonuclease/exonuclease/phosphatase family metal-dependent hydrolase